MDIILLQKVENLGGLGDHVKVKGGYGRNYLIPSGQAVAATAANIAAFEARRAELEKQMAEALSKAQERKEKIEQLLIRIVRRTGDQGRLFGSVGNSDIAQAAMNAGVPIEKQEIRLRSGALRTAGQFEVEVHLHSDVKARLKLEILPA